jgi:hypothetical protein
MAVKKYLSLDRLGEYDALIKAEIAEGDESVKSYVDAEVAKKANSSHSHDDKYYTESEIDTKISGVNSTITTHTGNTTVHITANERTNWNAAKTHADAAHAPSNAEKNIIIGIQKNGTDLTVDSSTRKVNITVPTTAAEVGAAASGHKHSASDITSGTLAVARGGTGAANASGARTNLEVYSTSEVDTKVSNAVSGLASTSSVNSAISTHNSSTSAHNDIREALASVKEDVDAFFKDATISDAAKDTLKEIQEYIASDVEAAAAMTASINNKSEKGHGHAIADVTGLQTALDGKAASSHGAHVTYSTTAPVMDGTASAGSANTVARSDHKHPVDTSRASQADLDALEEVVSGKANTSHTHTIANITNLQTTLDGKAASSHTHTVANISDLTATATELNYMDGVTSNVQTQLDGKAASGHGHDAATTSAAGFMTAAMVTKLNGIATGANKTTVDTALSSTSTNPVQNKVVNSAISTLTSSVTANTNSISAHTTAISNLQTAVSNIQEITSAEIQALFA